MSLDPESRIVTPEAHVDQLQLWCRNHPTCTTLANHLASDAPHIPCCAHSRNDDAHGSAGIPWLRLHQHAVEFLVNADAIEHAMAMVQKPDDPESRYYNTRIIMRSHALQQMFTIDETIPELARLLDAKGVATP